MHDINGLNITTTETKLLYDIRDLLYEILKELKKIDAPAPKKAKKG